MNPFTVTNKDIVRLSAVLLTLMFVVCPGTAVRAIAQEGQQPIVVNYLPGHDSAILVAVRINDTTSATFLLDTGAGTTAISSDLAERMKLHQEVEPGEDRRLVRVHSLHIGGQFGGISLSGIPLDILKLDGLSRAEGRKLDGLIGIDILRQYAVLFDFQQHRLTFCRNGKLSLAQRRALGMEKAHSVRIENIWDDTRYSALVRINGTVEEDLMIDTGAAKTGVSVDAARKLKLTSLGDLTSFSLSGDQMSHVAFVDKLVFGTFTTGATTVWYPERATDLITELLGMDLLTQHRVLMDFPANRMDFLPVERKTQVIAFSAKTDFVFPLFDVKLADGKVHTLGWNVSGWSTLDDSLAATWPAVPAELDPSPSPDSKTVASKLDYPTGKPLLDPTAFSLTALGVIRETLPMLDGWVGMEVLGQNALQLDFTAKHITLITPGNVSGTAFVAKGAVRIPYVQTDKGYVLQVLLDGKPATFVLNLLINATTLSSKTLLSALKPQAESEYVGKSDRLRYVRFHSLSVGNAHITDPVFIDRSVTKPNEPNYLGLDFLQRFHATIDFAGQALYLEPDANYKSDPAGHNSTGILPRLTAEGRIFVEMIADPSSAKEANVQLDDEILEVNGLLVRPSPLASIFAQFEKPVGTVVTVLIQHKGDAAPRTVKLTIRKTL